MLKRRNYENLLKGKQQDNAIGKSDPPSVITLGHREFVPALFTEELFEDLQVVSLNTCQPRLPLLLISGKRQNFAILLSWLDNECIGLPIHVTVAITAFALFLLLAIYAT